MAARLAPVEAAGNGGVAGSGSGGSATGTGGAGGLAGRGGSGGAGSGGSSGAGSGGAAGGRGGSGGSARGGSRGGSGGAGRAAALGGGARGGSGGARSGGGGAGGGGGSAGSGSGPEPFVFGVPPAAAAHFKKGINLGNRLEAPNEGDWGGTIQAEDFPFIAQRGFDHVRIPIRFSGHASAASPYTIDAAFFSRVDTVLDQAAAANLAVVVDMHAYDDLAADVAAQRDRFVALWTQIAARYQSRPDTVAFELLNEPNSQLDTTWNDVMLPAIRAIRATNPRRLLIVDSVFWADPTKLSTLTLPDDANIMASIHLYEPKLFTFQGQDWMGPAYLTTGVIFPGPPRDADQSGPGSQGRVLGQPVVHRLQHEARRHQSFGASHGRGADRADHRLPAKPGAHRLQRRVGTTGWRRAGLARPPGDGGPPAVRKRGHRVGDLGRPREHESLRLARGHVADRDRRRAVAAVAARRLVVFGAVFSGAASGVIVAVAARGRST